ncbi:CocE/NonD family hydrolase [Mycolicibacterium agri]|uniref:CocE/NonD family hydrolase n=1 Tax=Mycolicibacterium agri TaxID=36811 RepID=UPI0013D1DDE6|nr:CocE/NonD family hydrolase [Mycolicibacterium agri]
MIIEYDVPSVMRDGVTLRANIFRPNTAGQYPTVLVRTPYDKNVQQPEMDPALWARRGFQVIIQDTRGRFASEGRWEPFLFEAQDGYDSVEWAASLPTSNGAVGMAGASYCGNVQWLAAGAQPPPLAAIAPTFSWSDARDGLLSRGGALELGLALYWAVENGFDVIARSVKSEVEADSRGELLRREWDQLAERGYWELPVNDVAILRRHGIPTLTGIRPIDDDRVADVSTVEHRNVTVPVFHTGGWYDIFLGGTLRNFTAMRALGHQSRLMVGPWSHDVHRDPIGQRRFGMLASMDGAPSHPQGDWTEAQCDWFSAHLAPEEVESQEAAPIRIFVMGRNYWRDEQEWPPERAIRQRWYLLPDGDLRPKTPLDADADVEFEYDPARPVPTIGGHGVPVNDYTAGPFDQTAIESRGDVLVFSSAPLVADLEVTGEIRVVLWASSSAPSTDWVARLCDVHPDGRSFNICDGICRADAADGWRRYEIDLWATSNVFLAGHRLRVHVTSSSFPRWDRNLNTGNQLRAEYHVAAQRIGVGGARASYLDLPVIEQDSA